MNKLVVNSWHQGELSVQKRAGTAQKMAEIGPKFIREFMPQQHRDFFQSLSMIYIGYSDSKSETRASLLFGEPGFITSSSETTLQINTQYSLNDFNNNHLNVGDRIGLLGIEFISKRRNRLNVIITDINQKNIQVKVLQSYGNCPKYIQPKILVTNPHYDTKSTSSTVSLTQNIQELIINADAFFIASRFDDGQALNNRGVDISHRGGVAGFITINEKGQLLVPDYVGNGFFNTLGNLLENPIASLLFCDWQQGHAYQITVSSEILWSEQRLQSIQVNTQQKTARTLCFTPIKIEKLTDSLEYRVI
ncbi:pyridoxamine 5'-phosphate oxidase family protein [uncultured Psychromonas sp.]|uniref:pyridoxamine 5'-phosphate oxidase family protein n=1 Tax=uncultured Psychromonas sp. TaxID=173974 RepID=UPI00262698FC|nr:pyridoxamine 5'-phosphate oxidase family protein [uncultured Psychromonas sp.]